MKKLYILFVISNLLYSCDIHLKGFDTDCYEKYSDYDYRSSQIDIKVYVEHFYRPATLTYYKEDSMNHEFEINDISLDYLNEIVKLMKFFNYTYIDDVKARGLSHYLEMTCSYTSLCIIDVDFNLNEIYLVTKQGEYPCVDTYYKHYKVDEAELKPLLDDLEWIIKQDSID